MSFVGNVLASTFTTVELITDADSVTVEPLDENGNPIVDKVHIFFILSWF